MSNYKVKIVQTRTLEVPIDAVSPTEALVIAAQELRDNGSELLPEEWNHIENHISCKTSLGEMFIITSHNQ